MLNLNDRHYLFTKLILPKRETPNLQTAPRWTEIICRGKRRMRRSPRCTISLRIKDLQKQRLIRMHLRNVVPFMLLRVGRWHHRPHRIVLHTGVGHRRGSTCPLRSHFERPFPQLLIRHRASVTHAERFTVDCLNRPPDVDDSP